MRSYNTSYLYFIPDCDESFVLIKVNPRKVINQITNLGLRPTGLLWTLVFTGPKVRGLGFYSS